MLLLLNKKYLFISFCLCFCSLVCADCGPAEQRGVCVPGAAVRPQPPSAPVGGYLPGQDVGPLRARQVVRRQGQRTREARGSALGPGARGMFGVVVPLNLGN